MAAIAIISFKNAPRGQSRGGMRNVMNYCMRKDKTRWGEQQLVSGVNCTPASVCDDFLRTRLLHHKDKGRLYYHMVQSFPKGADVDPVTAHLAALRIAEWYASREVLVCTHTDREHIHSHFIINSVSLEDGKKLHIGSAELKSLMAFNDQICAEFGLPVFEVRERQAEVKPLGYAEYHAAAKGESWKFRLMNAVDLCMRRARTKKKFVEEMERLGYHVRWEENRKHITYTTPEGKRCRDVRLHDNKYLKEVMEREFRIREEIERRRIEETESAHAGDPHARFDAGEPERAVGHTGRTGPADADADRVGAGADGYYGANNSSDRENLERNGSASEAGGTGWEAERAEAFAGPAGESVHAAAPDALGGGHGIGDAAGAAVRLGRALEMNSAAPSQDATTGPHRRGDRKALAREKEKKIALGQKADDHEDFQQQLY